MCIKGDGEEEVRVCTFLRGEWRSALETAAARLGVLVWLSWVVLGGPGLVTLTHVSLRFLSEWWRWRCWQERRINVGDKEQRNQENNNTTVMWFLKM